MLFFKNAPEDEAIYKTVIKSSVYARYENAFNRLRELILDEKFEGYELKEEESRIVRVKDLKNRGNK